MEIESQPFGYETLDTSKGEVRLLTIHQRDKDASPDEPIKCTLSHVFLDAGPKYQALSYVWGDPNIRSSILLNGQEISITQNLYEALQRLTHIGEECILWADALCINQSDDSEKSSQVQLMTRIYSLAYQVWIWLGPERDNSTSAIHLLRDLGQVWMKQKSQPGWNNDKIYAFTRYMFQEQDQVDWNAIQKLLRGRPWFTRMWTLQEAILAKDAYLLCGEHSSRWDEVVASFEIFEWMILYASIEPKDKQIMTLVGDIYSHLTHWVLIRSSYENDGRKGLALLVALLWTAATRSIQATDPRDRIYGLLGLVIEQERGRIPVDYSKDTTLGKVLFHVSKALIEMHGPDVLTYIQQSNISPPLISWVVDWTMPLIGSIGDIELDAGGKKFEHRFNACKNYNWTPRSLEITYESPFLHFKGWVIGTIANVGQHFQAQPDSESYLQDCYAWLIELQDLVKGNDIDNLVNSNLWKVVIADTASVGRAGDNEACKKGYEILTKKLLPPDEIQDQQSWAFQESWDYRRLWRAYYRRAAIDEKGRPGLVPAHAQPGDFVAIFEGGHVPFVLRKDQDGATNLVGEAYFLGVMDGEGIDGNVPSVEIAIC
jgi:hypothetical protein